jgi:hypothetical protein
MAADAVIVLVSAGLTTLLPRRAAARAAVPEAAPAAREAEYTAEGIH